MSVNGIFRHPEISTNGLESRFVPVGALNSLRRDLMDKLHVERERNRLQRTGMIVMNDVPYPESELRYTGNVLNEKAREFYYRHGVTDIEPAAESGLDMQGRQVMTTQYCIKDQFGFCPKSGQKSEFKEPLFLVDGSGHRYRLEFNCRDCEMGVYY